MNYIELFAGCGGLSLGLKSVGFNLALANELSPMAAESYAYNFFDEDFLAGGLSKPQKTLWLSSAYGDDNLAERLRENPFNFPPLGSGYTDLNESGKNLDGALIVGSILQLNDWLASRPLAVKLIENSFGRGKVDLVSGGPPCQSFSMAGLRQKDNEKNSLPWAFAKFVAHIKPKFVLLENVTGILRPFIGIDGIRYYAWFEVAKAFAAIGYVPLCVHVNAKYAGVPQNRPRFVLIGVRADVLDMLAPTLSAAEKILFTEPLSFYKTALSGLPLELGQLGYRDISRPVDMGLIEKSFLSPLVEVKKFIPVKSAIHDLRSPNKSRSAYARRVNELFSSVLRAHTLQNHTPPANTELVRRRFRLYQVLEKQERIVKKEVLAILRNKLHEVSDLAWGLLQCETFYLDDQTYGRFSSKVDFLRFLDKLATKKQTQRALRADAPAPAALSIPDDACHYDEQCLRTLSVREMARIQTFPDNFVFRSKVTTGGTARRFQVPQYTQVGNAVPPVLGRALGFAIKNLLLRIK